MNIICITNLFPDSDHPGFAPFNLQQFSHLARRHDLYVISPVSWCRRLGLMLSGRSLQPPAEVEALMDVHYPVYYYTPGMLRGLYGRFYHHSIVSLFRRLTAEIHPHLVYSTWAYPDCYAAVKLSGEFGVPVVSRVHGSDVNTLFNYPGRREMIVEAMNNSARVISVSRPLGRKLVEGGVDEDRIRVVLNGVDRELFNRTDRESARAALGLEGDFDMILFAGNLKEEKGLDHLLRAFRNTGREGVQLHILGDGPRRKAAERSLPGSPESVNIFFHGRVPHRKMGEWFNASNVFCLPSLNEGTPNVILEALSCGIPVIASRTGGIPDIVDHDSGILFTPGDVDELSRTLGDALDREWDRERISCPAGSWEENAEKISGIFSEVVEGN